MGLGLFEKIMITFLLISGMILTGVAMINDLDDSYDSINMSDSADEFGEVYNTIDDIQGIGQDIKNSSLDSDIVDTDSWESMTKGSYSAIRLIPQTFSLYHALATSIGNTMGMSCEVGIGSSPACYWIDIGFISFMIIVATAVVYMIFRFKPT